jgi:hypothetical protein
MSGFDVLTFWALVSDWEKAYKCQLPEQIERAKHLEAFITESIQSKCAVLEKKLADEHENFLDVHRNNMRIMDWNEELSNKLAERDAVILKAKEILKQILLYDPEVNFMISDDAEKALAAIEGMGKP